MEIIPKKIAVYLGSAEGSRPVYREKIEELGTWIGKNGHTLIYGGSKAGLMGAVADACLSAGGKVTGVEPGFFVESEIQHEGITELLVTDTIAERRTKMIELSDVFIAFPGGTGTLEEISEVLSLRCLGRLQKPAVLFNLEGYYDPLLQMFDKMTAEGFVTPENRGSIVARDTLEEIYCFIEALP